MSFGGHIMDMINRQNSNRVLQKERRNKFNHLVGTNFKKSTNHTVKKGDKIPERGNLFYSKVYIEEIILLVIAVTALIIIFKS